MNVLEIEMLNFYFWSSLIGVVIGGFVFLVGIVFLSCAVCVEKARADNAGTGLMVILIAAVILVFHGYYLLRVQVAPHAILRSEGFYNHHDESATDG